MKKKIFALFFVFACCFGLIVPAQAMAQTFADVPASHWAYNYIERAYADEAVSGSYYNAATGVRKFSPEDKLTNAEFISIMVNALYADELKNSTATGKWYSAAEEVARKHNFFINCNFGPDNQTTRCRVALFLYNILEDMNTVMPNEAEFAEIKAKITDWNAVSFQGARNEKAVVAVVAFNIMSSKDASGKFATIDNLTRAEAATIYCRTMDFVNGEMGVRKANAEAAEAARLAAVVPAPVGTLSDSPVTLSLETHKPQVDYWSKAPADVQAMTDKDAFNAAVQTLKDKELAFYAPENRQDNQNNIYYNYACFEYKTYKTPEMSVSQLDKKVQAVTAAVSALYGGYGTVSCKHKLNNADNENVAVFVYSCNTDWKKDLVPIFSPIFEQFRSNMTDMEKAEIMLNAITDRFDYENSETSGFDWRGDSKVKNSRVGNCMSFSMAAQSIFNSAGLPTFELGGDVGAGAHAWNYAYLDGEWYVIDGTCAEVGRNNGIMSKSEHEEIFCYDGSIYEADGIKVIKALVDAWYNQ